jgi:MoaA/NifB/PqqE/SkfB family radical SAM enzyme
MDIGPILQWPVRALWYITDRCNLTCPYCLNTSSPHSAEGLDRNDALRVIDMLANGGVSTVSFLGGEPLCHPAFTELALSVAKHGMSLQLVTNGLLFDGATLDMLESLGHHLHWVQLSLHKRDRLDSYADLVSHLSRRDIRVHTLLVLAKKQLPDVPEVYRRIASAGASSFIITKVGQIGRASDGSYRGNIPTVGDLVGLVIELRRIKESLKLKTEPTFKHRGLVSHYLNNNVGLRILSHVCCAGISELQITASGQCRPCCFIKEDELAKYTTPSLLELRSLAEAWNGSAFKAFRHDKISAETSPVLSSCLECQHHRVGRCRPCLLNPSGCKGELRIVREYLGEGAIQVVPNN